MTAFRPSWKRWILTFGLALFAVVGLVPNLSPALASTPKHYTDLTFPPLREVQIPDYSRYQLENGLVVYLMEDHELPLVSGTLVVRTGDRWEPGDKVGLAGMMGEVMRSGGTTKTPADALNERLEQRAASVEVGIGTGAGNASFEALTEDVPEVFRLFAEVVQNPAFPQEKIDLAKTQRKGEIERRNDEPDSIAGREFQKLIYGSESPYARTIEYRSLNNITRPDLEQFYGEYFHPNNMILGIVGDFQPQQMRELINQSFGKWAAKPDLKTPAIPQANQAKTEGIFFVNQPQLTQSSILMGHLGGRLDDPDYAALDVVNGLFNGLGGRLFNEVRSRQGLAYSVYGFWDAEYDYPGTFLAGGQTRSEATVPFIKSIFQELERIRTKPLTPAELTYAKDSVLNSFVFNFQDPGQTLSRLMRYEYYGYPTDFIFRYQKAIQNTTIADVQRAAQKHLKPEQIVTLVVGNEAQIKPALTTLTPTVTPIDITIPKS